MSEKDQLLQQLDKIQECFQKKCAETKSLATSAGAHAISAGTSTRLGAGVNMGTMAAPHTLAVGTQYLDGRDPQTEEEIKVRIL